MGPNVSPIRHITVAKWTGFSDCMSADTVSSSCCGASDYCPSLEYHSLHCWDCTRDAVHHIHCWMQSTGVASFCIVQRSMSDRTARNRAAGVYPNDLVSRLREYSNCKLCWKLLNPSTYHVHLHPGPLFAVRWAPPTREALCCSMRRSKSMVAPM